MARHMGSCLVKGKHAVAFRWQSMLHSQLLAWDLLKTDLLSSFLREVKR